jgi:lipopolysaccharide transport system permease protein
LEGPVVARELLDAPRRSSTPLTDTDQASTRPNVEPIVVKPSSGWRALNLADLWRYRELVYFLAARDVQVKYKQTALGAAWALLQPLLAMAVFTLFLGTLARVPSDGLPYPLFAFLGLLPWTYFANATTTASTSLVTNSALIAKVYFPRLVVPLASVLSGLLDFAIGLVLLLLLVFVFGVELRPSLLWVPVLVVLTALTALSVSLWLSALDVHYRDVRSAIPFSIQVWMFATPVVYPASLIPEHFRVLYGLNPMAGIVEGFRWAVAGSGDPPGAMLGVSVLATSVVLITGLFYFRRTERTFADVV